MKDFPLFYVTENRTAQCSFLGVDMTTKQVLKYVVFWVTFFFVGMGTFSVVSYTEVGKRTSESLRKVIQQTVGVK